MSEFQTSCLPSLAQRIVAASLDDHAIVIVVGALNSQGRQTGVHPSLWATASNLAYFSWAQALNALHLSRAQSTGDALDDLVDAIIAVRQAQRRHVDA